MPKIKASSQRERTSLKRPAPEATRPEPKRQKLDNHSSGASSSAHYLDSLSKVWLTKEALRELDRRTQQARSKRRSGPLRRRPLTHGFHHELRGKIRSTTTPASDSLQRCSPESLREIKLSARNGGPDLLDLRGYPEPAHPSRYTMSSSQSGRLHRRGKRGTGSASGTLTTITSTAITRTTRSSGAYNPNFKQRMIDNGIYPHGYKYTNGRVPPKPENWREIQQMLEMRRASLSPSLFPEEEFEEFSQADANVSSENKVITKMIPMIQGVIQDESCVDGAVPFNNLANMMGGNSHTVKPDVFYGARPEKLVLAIRDQLSTTVVPSTITTRPIAPNFFVEAKRPGADDAAALIQACIVGAAGARGIHSLQTYGEEVPSYDRKAYTLSTTYQAGTLKMFTHYLGPPNGAGANPEYYMHQVNGWFLTGNRRNLLEGLTAFRNAEAWTEAQRDAAIAQANAVGSGAHGEEDDDDEDEDSGENDVVTAADPILSSFSSQSPLSAGQRTSLKGKAVR